MLAAAQPWGGMNDVVDSISSPASSWWTSHSFGSTLLAASDRSATSLDEAFTDTVDFTSTPFQLLGGITVVLFAVLLALKSITNKMDQAIGQVLQDFESTMKSLHPTRWQKIREELDGLTGDERDIKLLQVMETMQDNDPEFMMRVRDQMPKR
jgi:hypothetical protein